MLSGHRVVHPTDTSFGQRPEPLYGVRMDIPTYVHLLRMVNPLVVIPFLGKRVIGTSFIGVDRRSWYYSLLNAWHQVYCRDIGNGHSNDSSTLSLNHSKHGGFTSGPATTNLVPLSLMHVVSLPAKVGLIGFNRAIQGVVTLFHQFMADKVGHTPRCLVGDAKFSLQLLSGDTAAGANHQVHSVEPQVKGSRGLVEYGSSGGVDVVTTSDARPGLLQLLRLVLPKHSGLFALGAKGVLSIVGVALSPEPFQTCGIVGKLLHKLHHGVFRF